MLPSSTVENYIKAIYLGQTALTADARLVPMGQVAAALGVTPGTATTMVKTLAESGLAAYEPYSGVRLTPAGERLAGAKHLGVRPEHLQVHAGGEGVAATVVLAEHLGDASVLHMRVQGVADLLKAKVAANSGPFQAGQMVFLRAPAEAVLGFDAVGKVL